MLNYEIHMEPREVEILENELREDLKLSNPFPGLRPFTIEECHLFFGREGQVDEILVKLAENKFVAVLGYSGSGKSSMLYCGLVPILQGGFMVEKGPDWNIITCRPGISPLDNLSQALLEHDPEYDKATDEERLVNKTIFSSILKGGNNGLSDLAKRLNLVSGQNLLLIVDQFEELFRYRTDESIKGSEEESSQFVSLLMEAANQTEVPIYVALSMRSDYIGECAQYPGLTQLINDSNYLVPQMSREQKRIAIEGPVAVGGGKISNRLVKRLLTDVGDSQDQLPILQHALMRTWDYWAENREPGEPMDIRHYNAVGRISEALSQHANEAYEELSTREKEIAEILFKTITEKGNDLYGIRRPTQIGVIAEIAGVDAHAVAEVVEKFRQPGRSLLMPPSHVKLTDETIIEVSHESLIRIWTRLKNWVNEENESAQMYLRLSEAAAMYQIGRTGLWRPPDLQLALNWQKKQNPSRVWAQRYDEAFERAIVFLDTSRITYEAEQKNQEMQQKRLLRRTRMVAVILAIAAIIAIIFFIFGITQQIAANEQRLLAINQRDAAVQAQQEADRQRVAAERAQQEALENAETARLAQIQAEENLQEAIRQSQIAQQQTQIALQQKAIADSARIIAEDATLLAEQKAQEASDNFQAAQRLLFLSIAQSMSVKSLNIGDPDLRGLLAQQAYFFNTTYDGNEFDNYIYDGVYNAMAFLKGPGYNRYSGHKDAVRAVDYGNNNKFYSGGSDGKVLAWDQESGKQPVLLLQNEFPNRVIKVSPDQRWLVNASDSTFLQLIDLSRPGSNPTIVRGHTDFIYDVAFMPDNSGFFSVSNDLTMRFYDFNRSRLVKNLPAKIKSIDLSPDGSKIAAAGLNGMVYLMDTRTLTETLILENPGNFMHSVVFSNSGKYLAIGDEVGLLRIYDLETNQFLENLIGPRARINDIEFSNDDKLIAAGSWDGTIHIWLMENLDNLPIKLDDINAHVWDLTFSDDNEYLIAATGKNDVRIWPTNPKTIADNLCEELQRNMTDKEWDRFVGNGIEYDITCTSLSVSEIQ